MEDLKRHFSSRCGYRSHLKHRYYLCLKKLIAKVTELTEQYKDDQSTQFDPTMLTDLHEQLGRKSDILQELDGKMFVLIANEEDLEREVMEAEEHHSLLSTHIAQIVKLLEACTAVKHATVQVPLQLTTEDPPSESNHSVAPPTISDHSSLELGLRMAQEPKKSPTFQS